MKIEGTTQITVLSEKRPEGFAGPASWGSGTDGTEMVTWQDNGLNEDGEDNQSEGFYGCLQGQYQGNWFEGEDQGPFETREEAEQSLRSDYEDSQEEVPSAGRD